MMPKEQIPVTPALITWARTRAGYSLEEAQKTFNKIEAWETGEAFPTYGQLEQLGDKFKLPIAVFFFPEPPKVVPISESFRTLPESQFSEIPRRIQFLLRKAKAFQLNLIELNQGRNPAARLITRDLSFRLDVPVEEMARRVREYLGITLDQQKSWDDSAIALENWRDAFQDVGIFIFKDAFKVAEYSGFCLYEETFPLIYVNNSTAKTRQIFTLFHELAHLLFHTSGIDTLSDDYIPQLSGDAQRIEILCNRFSSHFLVPEDAFEAAFGGREPSENVAEELAALFHVSREFIFRIFLDRGLINQDVYNAAAKRWAAQRDPEPGGDYYNNQISYLGLRYIRLALSRYHQNRIDETQLADYLNIAPKNVATFETRLARRRA
jgi:Zn-dependent peptidase ImmA (M78 family)